MTFGRSLLIGLMFLAVPSLASATTVIKGRILYGDIRDNLNEAQPPGGEATCDPAIATCGFLHRGDPIAHVWVQLNDGAGIRRDSTFTDENGEFEMEVNGTPNLTLVVKAKNDYGQVKKYNGPIDNWATDDVLKTEMGLSGINYNVENDLGDLTMVDDDVDFWLHDNTRNNVSRAFYITTAAHSMGTYVESLLGQNPGFVGVRMGLPSTAFYYTVSNTIFLSNTDSSTFWHEYGHFLQDRLGGFDLIPAYAADGGHQSCTQMSATTLREVCDLLLPLPGWSPCDALANDNTPSLNWAWIEGFGTFWGKAAINHHYGSDAAAVNALDNDHACEGLNCNTASWTEPRAVEAVVAAVLWDLVDDVQDADNGSGIDEIADYRVADVMQVFDTGVLGLEEFWQEWTGGRDEIQPYLYAAYAFNGADLGSAEDVEAPEKVTIESRSDHIPHGGWNNNAHVTLEIIDGEDPLTPLDHDDVSGSYRYFITNDDHDLTEVPTILGTEAHKSEGTSFAWAIELPEGGPQYIHVNNLDMAGHEAGTTHFGPLFIDTVDPVWVSLPQVIFTPPDPGVVSNPRTLVLGYPALLKWSSNDATSGVAEVEVVLEDLVTGQSYPILTTIQQALAYNWMVEDVPVTQNAQITFTVTDYAGNSIEHSIPVKVVPHFRGPITQVPGSDNGNCDDGRAISADLTRDGFDDVVLVCRINNGGHLFVFGGTPNGLVLIQDFVWPAADDLAAADLDRDGDLDVATVSFPIPAGANTTLDILMNDGTGTLVNPPIQRPLQSLARKTVRVLTPNDGKLPRIFVFGVLAAVGNQPQIRVFDVPNGYVPLAAPPGLDPVDGDWEQADMNGDGYQDLVALGIDGAGTPALSVFSGGPAGWSRADVETYGSATAPDVDLGDFDSDGRTDIAVMFEDAGQLRVTKLLRSLAGVGGYVTFAEATDVAQQLAQGRGYITDHANDAQSEVVSMGINAAGDPWGWYLRNDNIVGQLVDVAPPGMTPLAVSDTAWGDFDKDGDLDVVHLARDPNGLIFAEYENLLGDYIDQNDAPRRPTNLNAIYDTVRGGYLFTWSPAAPNPDETPTAGIGYELRIGTSLGGGQVLSWEHPAGASQQGASLSRFVRMPQGSYFYDVRAVDSGWLRSQGAGTKPTP